MLLILSVISVVAAVFAAGFFYQWIGARTDRARFTTQGRWVNIGSGCELYLVERGSGGPTVLFESGIAATNLNWCHIQQLVSGFTHTASYDRGGLGWSSACLTPRTPGNIAIELHTMLESAGIKPPYILVGHSFGGLVMRRFAVIYPREVAGVVLVDPMRPEDWPPLNPVKQATLDRGARLTGFAIPVARFGFARLAVTSLLCRSGKLSGSLAAAAGNGGRHVLGRVKDEVSKMPRSLRPMVAAHWSRPGFYAGMRSHVAAVPDTVREMQDAEPIRGIPVTLLTPGTSIPLSEIALRQIGENVQQIIAKASGHWIHLDEPDLVIASIRAMVSVEAAQSIEIPV